MRYNMTADEESVVASPSSMATAIPMKSRSPGMGRGGGRRVSPAMANTAVMAESSVLEVDQILPNGDMYVGELAGNAPHGHGKYTWIDGCIYNGEWRKGVVSGKGKFSWPSGATYDGEFKGGKMDGYGVFTAANGETYHGYWFADRKHGYGKKLYANGDFYEGLWKRDLQDGQGRYMWRNSSQYVGEWRNGMISGRGVLSLADGSLHDGQWDNGVPKRSSVFPWPDCSCYLGSKDPKSNQHVNGSSLTSLLPSRRQTIAGDSYESEATSFENTGNVEPSMICEDRQYHLPNDICLPITAAKNSGQTISKGHKSYDLVLSLQLGIRYSACNRYEQATNLWPSNFDTREKFWTRFPAEGTKSTPPHPSPDFKWKDYCPRVFGHLRKLFMVYSADFVRSICRSDSLREFSSSGKSGSLFFLTQDDRFIIKTVKKCEVKVLIKMLLSYYQHICKHENSLLTKFYGLHCVKPVGGQKVRFIVMGNLFCTELEIDRRFDLKGSSHGRTIRRGEEDEVDETTTMKDLDLNFVFRLQKPWFKSVICQIERDCEFLEAEGIMDYSLLVGFHFRDDLPAFKKGTFPADRLPGTHGSFQGQGTLIKLSFSEAGRWDTATLMVNREPLIRLGSNMPARAEHVFHGNKSEHNNLSNGGVPNTKMPLVNGKIYQVVLYFGIIDILRDYDISKKLEHAYKSLQVDSASISAVDPKLYSRRFRDFIGRVFVEDD